MRRFTHLLVAGAVVAGGLSAIVVTTASPAWAVPVETCKKMSGLETLNPGIPVQNKADPGGVISGTGVSAGKDLYSPLGIFTTSRGDAAASKIVGIVLGGDTGTIPAGDTIDNVVDAHNAVMASAGTNGTIKLKLKRFWSTAITAVSAHAKNCSGAVGTGLVTDTAVTTMTGFPITTSGPGNCTTILSPVAGEVEGTVPYTTSFYTGAVPVLAGTVTGNLTVSNTTPAVVGEELFTFSIATSNIVGIVPAVNSTTVTVNLAPTNPGGCVTTNVTQFAFTSVPPVPPVACLVGGGNCKVIT